MPLKINDAFVPPKPKEFERAKLIFFCILVCGTKFMSQQSLEILSKLIVGGIILLLIDNIENIDSIAPDAPNRCPVADLVEDIWSFLKQFEKSFFTALNSISSPRGVDVPCALI